MTRLADLVPKIRSKNAGPFWLTVDVFCGSDVVFRDVCARLETGAVAAALGTEPDQVKRFDIAALNVVKLSVPRPQVQGTPSDRDMHGASFAILLGAIDL